MDRQLRRNVREIGRRAALELGLCVALAPRLAMAQTEPARERPKENDHLVLVGSTAVPEPLRPDELPLGGKPALAWPMDPIATRGLAEELAGRGIDMMDAPAMGTLEDARNGGLNIVIGGQEAVVERCRPIFEVLGKRILRAGAVGSGQASIALADFLRGVELLAASEAPRVAERCGLEAGALLDIGEGLSAIGSFMSGLLRREVLTRKFDSGLALGHLSKHLETASNVARARGVETPLLAACRNLWAAAEGRLGSGADQTALVRWLETLAPAAAKTEA